MRSDDSCLQATDPQQNADAIPKSVPSRSIPNKVKLNAHNYNTNMKTALQKKSLVVQGMLRDLAGAVPLGKSHFTVVSSDMP